MAKSLRKSSTKYMIKASLNFVLILGILLFTTSCLSNKRVVYYQSKTYKLNEAYLIENIENPYKLQVSDLLSIVIKSKDLTLDAQYNLGGGNMQGGGGAVGGNETALYVRGYIVDENGNVTLPILGDIQVLDKTITEAKEAIQTELSKYLKDAVIDIKLLNFRVAVYGEVKRPGFFSVNGNRISIFQAIADAGDLNEFANRNNVKLIRQTPKGMEMVVLDLTKEAILSSPYYYLQPNDQIYVEPLKARTGRTNLPLLSVVFSAISSTVLLLNFINNSRNR